MKLEQKYQDIGQLETAKDRESERENGSWCEAFKIVDL